jgi:hypothetical protein
VIRRDAIARLHPRKAAEAAVLRASLRALREGLPEAERRASPWPYVAWAVAACALAGLALAWRWRRRVRAS